MKTIAIINQKGGAGKTTLTVHLATAASMAGLVTLIIDTDPQASASIWSQWRGYGEPEVIDCGSPALLPRKIEQATELGADLVIIDTPPHAEGMARTAAGIADLILMPCKPNPLDLAAASTTADLIRSTGKPAYLVFSDGAQRAPTTYAEARELVEGSDRMEGMGIKVSPHMLTSRAAFKHATGSGRTAQETEPDGKAAAEVADLWMWTSGLVGVSTRKHKKGKAA